MGRPVFQVSAPRAETGARSMDQNQIVYLWMVSIPVWPLTTVQMLSLHSGLGFGSYKKVEIKGRVLIKPNNGWNKLRHQTGHLECERVLLTIAYVVLVSSRLHVQYTVYTTHFENKFLASSEYCPKPPQPPPKPLKGAGTENFGLIYLDNLGTIWNYLRTTWEKLGVYVSSTFCVVFDLAIRAIPL